jgi:fatty acid-binding protein DegV
MQYIVECTDFVNSISSKIYKTLTKQIQAFIITAVRIWILIEIMKLAILHAGVQKEAEAMLERIKHFLPGGDISIVQISPVLGAHLGVGALGFACISKKESR